MYVFLKFFKFLKKLKKHLVGLSAFEHDKFFQNT